MTFGFISGAATTTIVRPPAADLYFTRYSFFLLLVSFLFFRPLISNLAEQNSTKIGHIVGSKCNLIMHVRNLNIPPPTNRGPKNNFLDDFATQGNFNGLCFRNETRYSKSVKCVHNYKVSPTSSQNVMNFGTQTASNWTVVFTHPP